MRAICWPCEPSYRDLFVNLVASPRGHTPGIQCVFAFSSRYLRCWFVNVPNVPTVPALIFAVCYLIAPTAAVVAFAALPVLLCTPSMELVAQYRITRPILGARIAARRLVNGLRTRITVKGCIDNHHFRLFSTNLGACQNVMRPFFAQALHLK